MATLARARAGRGPPLVLLHGFTGSAPTRGVRSARASPRAFASSPSTCPATARRRAPRRRPLPLARVVADLVAVLDALGVGRAALARLLAGRAASRCTSPLAHPSASRALVLESASPGIADAGRARAAPPRTRRSPTPSSATASRRSSTRGCAAAVRDAGAPAARACASARARAAPARLRAAGYARTRCARWASARRTRFGRGSASCGRRSLLVAGDGGRQVSADLAARDGRRRCPTRDLAMIAGAGHAVHLEQPRAWLARDRSLPRRRLRLGATAGDRLNTTSTRRSNQWSRTVQAPTYTDILYDAPRASPRSPSTGRRCATPSGRRRSFELMDAFNARARGPRRRRRHPHRRRRRGLLLGRRPAHPRRGGLRRRRRRAAAERARPAAPDPHPAEAGDRDGRGLRDRRRARAARGLRPDDRGRQRRLRSDRPRVGSFDGGFGATYLARIVGHKKAREIWYLCRRYDARQALEMGLVNTVVPLDRARGGDGRVVPRDPAQQPARPPLPEGGVQRRHRRPRRHPGARRQRDAALLHVGGGAGRAQRLPREARRRTSRASRACRERRDACPAGVRRERRAWLLAAAGRARCRRRSCRCWSAPRWRRAPAAFAPRQPPRRCSARCCCRSEPTWRTTGATSSAAPTAATESGRRAVTQSGLLTPAAGARAGAGRVRRRRSRSASI